MPAYSALFASLLCAQSVQAPDLPAEAAALRALVDRSTKSVLAASRITLQAPRPAFKIGYPSAVAMDDSGLIYILHRGEQADPIQVVDRKGKIVRSWGKGLYLIPHSIRIAPDGNIWTTDSGSSMVLQFSPKGEKLMEIAVGEVPAGRTGARGTTDIAFGPNGRIYIADGYGNSRILEYDRQGARVRQWGSAGTGPGQFNQPHGIAIDDRGIVYVADRNNARLQRFDLDGKYLGEWSHLGKVTAVAFRGSALWVGSQLRNESNEANGWQFRVDRSTGKILEYAISDRSHHVLNINSKGELFAGARPDIPLWFRSGR